MTKDTDFFCYCDLPPLPDWFTQEIIDSVEDGYNNNTNLQFEKRPMDPEQIKQFDASKNFFKMLGRHYKRAIYRRYNLSENAKQWVLDNIGEYSQMGSQLMRNGDAFTPHTDGGPRRYILNYLVESGGAQVETQFLEEPEKGLIREGVPIQIPDGSNLVLVKSVVAPEKSWMMIFGKIVHSVVGITGKRIQLSISFSAEEFKKVKEKHKLELTYYG